MKIKCSSLLVILENKSLPSDNAIAWEVSLSICSTSPPFSSPSYFNDTVL